MKNLKLKLLFLASILLAMFADSFGQTVTQDKNGNYIQSKTVDTVKGVPTGKTFITAKGEEYPVFKTKTGKLYVLRISKNTGNYYKQYLKIVDKP
jgi:hypothetical protein